MVVIDDDAELLAALGDALDDPRFQVECFADPRAALESISLRRPALVITDLGMPSISGRDVIKAIRTRFNEGAPPVIVLSGDGEEDVMLECFGLGASDYLTKPISVAELRVKAAVLMARQTTLRMDTANRSDAVAMGGGSHAGSSATAGQQDPSRLPPGAHFGPYEILKQLGAGGMGVVYQARSQQHGVVALKVLAPELSNDHALLRRFFREARNLKSVRHPNVVSFLDLGHEAGTYFLVMECAAGEPLDQRFAPVLPLEEARALGIAVEIAAALDALSRAQIVHRDLKPANVMVDDEGHIKLVDFGLTKRPHEEELTDTDVLMGTPHYLSPEQITGSAALDIRSDLYSLGVILFYLMSGVHPFVGETPFAILQGHAFAPIPLVSSVNPSVSERADQLVTKLLAKRPGDRFQSPAELLSALMSARPMNASP